MKNLFKILIIVALGISVTSCASKHKKEDKKTSSGETDFYSGSGSKSKASKPEESEPSDEEEASVQRPSTSVSTKDFAKTLNTNDEEKVLEEASKILSSDPSNVKVLNGLGVFYLKQRKPDMAKYFFAKVLKVDPSNSATMNNLGVIAVEDKEERKAMEYFKKAIDVEADNVAALGNLGSIYLKYEDYEKAVSVLKKAYGYNKSNITIGNNYAVALAGTNEIGRALDIYEDLAKTRNGSVQLNEAILWAEFKQDFTKAKELLNKIRILSTDPGILKKVNDISKWMESKQQQKKQ